VSVFHQTSGQRYSAGDCIPASTNAAAADAAELLIPDLNWRTASVLGLPLPPPLNIAIRPNKFEVSGTMHT
jgi:hypothetical protein